jgi:hypothetical protein
VSGDRVAYSLVDVFSPTCSGETFWSYKFGGTTLPFDCSSLPAVEFLSPDISGHVAVYKKRFSSSLDPEALYIKDLDSTSAPIRITAATHHPVSASIGANTVAWIDGSAPTSSSPYGYQPLLYDLTTQLTTALGPLEFGYNYGMTSVSESGDVVAWVKCESSNSFNCSVFRGLKSGGNWTVAQIVNWTNGVSVGSVSTNSQWIVTSTSGTGTLGSNIRWLPVALDEQGNPGPMEQLDLGASLANQASFAAIAEDNLIVYINQLGLFVYDIDTRIRYEFINVSINNGVLFPDISVSNGCRANIVYRSPSDSVVHGLSFKYVKPPEVFAGADQTVNEGDTVVLYGTASDHCGDNLTYEWTQLPGGPTVQLSGSTSLEPTFIAPDVPVGGVTLTFQLTAKNEKFSKESIVNVKVGNVNHPPVAIAGGQQTVQEAADVTLDGSNSYDPDGEALTYTWLQTSGTSVNLSDPHAAKPTLKAPLVAAAGETLTFSLTVSDGVAEATASALIHVENVNHAPIADAGPTQSVQEGASVILDGSNSSDPDGDPLSFVWHHISGTPVTLSDESASKPTFMAPAVSAGGESLTFQLVVNDNDLFSTPAEVAVQVLDVKDPPDCSTARAEPAVLWPPTHKLVPIAIQGLADNLHIMPQTSTQDEPVIGLGAGDTNPDTVINGEQILVRAERKGSGNGRVYQIGFTATDEFGDSCNGKVLVCVPINPIGGSCIDDGQAVNLN